MWVFVCVEQDNFLDFYRITSLCEYRTLMYVCPLLVEKKIILIISGTPITLHDYNVQHFYILCIIIFNLH